MDWRKELDTELRDRQVIRHVEALSGSLSNFVSCAGLTSEGFLL
jgi:hypothetical protein